MIANISVITDNLDYLLWGRAAQGHPGGVLLTLLMAIGAAVVARRFFLHQNAINFALPEGAKKTHSAQCKNERKECLVMLLLSRITFVESRQADPIFESYITM